MRNNIFIKSMLRQRVRTAILVLLIAAAAFAFVMRAVEYFIVTEQLKTIAGFYRSIGFLQLDGGEHAYYNVITGADAIKDSEYIAFEDRRRGAEGTVAGMFNSNIEGFYGYGNPWVTHTQSHTDSFFYGELIALENLQYSFPQCVELTVRVDHVLTGYPEHVTEEQVIMLRYYLGEAEKAAQWAHIEEHGGEAIFPETPVDGMVVGQRYLLRGVYYGSWSVGLPAHGRARETPLGSDGIVGLPVQGETLGSILTMHPLNEKIDFALFTRETSDEPI